MKIKPYRCWIASQFSPKFIFYKSKKMLLLAQRFALMFVASKLVGIIKVICHPVYFRTN